MHSQTPGLACGFDSEFLSKHMPKLPNSRDSLQFFGLSKRVKTDERYPPRKTEIRYGPTSGTAFSVAHTPSNWKRGLLKRCAHQFHPHDVSMRSAFFAFVREELKKYPVLPVVSFEELQDEWLSNANYNLERKSHLRKCADEYFNGQVSPREMNSIKSFIKAEFYTELKEPRIINSRSDYFKAVVGPYIHYAEKFVYDDHFIKHLRPSQVVDRLNGLHKHGCIYYGTDYSSFEGSFDPELQRHVERALWDKLFANYPRVLSLIQSAYGTNHVFYRKKYHASFKGSRMSGDMWTSLANGFTNLMAAKFMSKVSQADTRILVEGDDGFIASNRELDLSVLTKLGFKITKEVSTEPSDIEFCSLRVCKNTLIPDITRTLTHYGYIVDPALAHNLENGSKRAFKRLGDIYMSKAMSLLATSAGVPILQSLALQQMRVWSGHHLRSEYCDWWERNFFDLSNPAARPIDDEVREYVAQRFDIPVARQIEIEKALETWHDRCFTFEL